MITTNIVISALLVWSVCQHAADGRYVDADDFSTLATEVTAMKEERLEFNDRISKLELKLDAGEAQLNAVENKLSVAEAKLAETEDILRTVEGKLSDALSRIDELDKRSGLSRDQEELINNEAFNEGPGNETDEESEVLTEAPAQKTGGIRERYTANGNVQTVSKRTVSTTTPHIAFSVYLNNDLTNLGYQSTIRFDAVELNEGNGYDAIMDVFICPVSGVYMFQSALFSELHDDRIETEIVKDGALLVRLYAAGSTGSTTGHGLDQGFNSVITTCNQGEHVWVRLHATVGTAMHRGRFSSFSGYLLWEN